MKPQKTELFKMWFLTYSWGTSSKCNMQVLQNAPIGAFCNTCMLHLALVCQENVKKHKFKSLVFTSFCTRKMGFILKVFIWSYSNLLRCFHKKCPDLWWNFTRIWQVIHFSPIDLNVKFCSSRATLMTLLEVSKI